MDEQVIKALSYIKKLHNESHQKKCEIAACIIANELEQIDIDNRDLDEAITGMIADREYFERIATQPCSQCVQRGIGADECRQYSRIPKLEDNS
jgi:hypothetical protein